jgi:enoyl-[acyl-carrier-protein] reductase (NADH)
MLEIILSIGVAALVINTGFTIAFILGMKRTGDRINAFIESTNSDAVKSLADLKGTLENIHKISEDVSAVTSDVRQISHAVANVERNFRNLFEELKRELSATVEAHTAGLKAGIVTGAASLVKSINERGDDHERRSEE